MIKDGVFFVFLLLTLGISAQDRSALEAQRNDIIQAIEATSELLNKTKDEKEVTLKDFKIVERQIANREELINNLKSGIDISQSRITTNQGSVDSLSQAMELISKQYNTLLRSIYLKDKTGMSWTKYLSVGSINTAIRQWIYARQFNGYVQEKKNEVRELSQQLVAENQTLATAVSERSKMLVEEKTQSRKLAQEKEQKDKILKQLLSKEAALKKQLNKQKKERENLNAEIEKVIIAALKAPKENKAEDKLTGIFNNDKGKLPWPIDNGVIMTAFGNRPHPTIKNVIVANNGIDIASSKATTVKAVYQGQVVAVSKVPGYDYMIIIRHGNFYTVYSRLDEIMVAAGDAVVSGSAIGRLTNPKEDGIVLHFELWEDKVKLNPENWLR